MSAAVAAAPNADTPGVNPGERAGIRDGMPVILGLLPRIQLLTRQAIASAQIPKIKEQNCEARARE
jgi:hypothetical protein